MSQHPTPPFTELPSPEAVEEVLGLGAEDRRDLPGLHRLNAIEVPRTRLLGLQLLVAFVLLHNTLRDVGASWLATAIMVLLIEVYAVGQWVVLRRYFARSKRVHLGTVFLASDVPILTLAVYATGGHASLIWPVYVLRVADQLWIGRARAAWMGALGVVCYLALLMWTSMVEGARPDLAAEIVKVGSLVAFTMYLVFAAQGPWNVQDRTQAAKSLIMKLEEQSLELDEARRRAEAASRAKSDFLARMSHELRTPLNSVVGFTNLLLRREATPPEIARDYLGRIKSNGVYLLALINDILDITRIERGRLDIKMEPVDLEVLVRETVSQLESRIHGGNASMSVQAPDVLLPLRADEVRLRQVLVNLVGNAIKFTPSGWIQVAIRADDGGRPFAVDVTDTGVGISPQQMERVFAAFEQGDGSTTRRFGGTGLGLAISRSLCEGMGFTLSVVSAEGQGSTFTIGCASDEGCGEGHHTPDGGTLSEPPARAG